MDLSSSDQLDIFFHVLSNESGLQNKLEGSVANQKENFQDATWSIKQSHAGHALCQLRCHKHSDNKERKKKLQDGKKEKTTCKFREGSPGTMPILVDVVNKSLVLFRTPCPFLHCLFITTWWSSHLLLLRLSFLLLFHVPHSSNYNPRKKSHKQITATT